MTKTAKKVLKNIAGHWRIGSAAILKGPTSSGKTSYIKYLAYQTQSPYRRINLSYNTDVRDLLGRWIAGEEKYSLEALQNLSYKKLINVAKSMGYKSPESLSQKSLIKEIFEWQKQPHWDDGPVATALRHGEILLLDEINLARPQVIEALNSLFDSGKITLDDNDITPLSM